MSESMSAPRTLPAGTFALPAGWQLLPSIDINTSEWVETYLDELPVQPSALVRAQLRYALMTVIDFSHRLPGEGRYNFALIGEPLQGIVHAVLSVQKLRVTDEAYDNLLYRVQNPPPAEGVESINRTVEEYRLAAGRAIVMHDFIVPVEFEPIPEPATERTTLSLFADDSDSLLDFAMYAQDLAAFDDMPAYLVEIVGAISPIGDQS